MKMPAVIAFISQKGGVGKSTLARALAAVAAHAGIQTVVADLDPRQQTAVRWGEVRHAKNVAPEIAIEGFADIDDALQAHTDCELLVVDTPGQSDATTLHIAERSHVVVIPTGPTLDDLYPAVLLLHELAESEIPAERLAVALCHILSKGEEEEARRYITAAGYEIFAGSLPERAVYRDAQNQGLAVSEIKDLDPRVDKLLESMLQKVMQEVKRHAVAKKTAAVKKGTRA
jgi:chromosome partitioning protein